MPIAPHNPRNTNEPIGIEYRVENRIEKQSDDIRLNQSILYETHNLWG